MFGVSGQAIGAFVQGFKIIGALLRSLVYPADPRFDPDVDEAALLDGADDFVLQAIERVKKTTGKADLEESAHLDISKNFAGELMTKAAMDAKYRGRRLAPHPRIRRHPGQWQTSMLLARKRERTQRCYQFSRQARPSLMRFPWPSLQAFLR